MKYEIIEIFATLYASVGAYMFFHLVSLLIYGPRKDLIYKALSAIMWPVMLCSEKGRTKLLLIFDGE